MTREHTPNNLLQIIINMYKNNSIIIKLNDNTTDCQSINQEI